MNKISIRDSIKQQPFRPFVVHVVDGRRFDVNSLDYVFVSPVQDIIFVFVGKHYYIIDIDKIVSLEII